MLQEYSPAAEVLIQQAKAPGADGGSYINAAKHVASAPQVCPTELLALGRNRYAGLGDPVLPYPHRLTTSMLASVRLLRPRHACQKLAPV